MKRIAVAATVGMLAFALLAAAYFAPPYLHWPVDPAKVLAVAVILTAAMAVATLLMVAMNRPAAALQASTVSPLNAYPAEGFVAWFVQDDKKKWPAPVSITARPALTCSEILVRHGDLFKNPDKYRLRPVVVSMRAAKKNMFNPVVLKDLFERLKPLPNFYHVLLLDESDGFVGYIPGDSAKKEFTGENAETKIAKFVVDVLADPAKSTTLRTIKGASRDDTIAETADLREAALKFWIDEEKAKALPEEERKKRIAEPRPQGLVVYRHLKPVGFLAKDDIFIVSTTSVT